MTRKLFVFFFILIYKWSRFYNYLKKREGMKTTIYFKNYGNNLLTFFENQFFTIYSWRPYYLFKFTKSLLIKLKISFYDIKIIFWVILHKIQREILTGNQVIVMIFQCESCALFWELISRLLVFCICFRQIKLL